MKRKGLIMTNLINIMHIAAVKHTCSRAIPCQVAKKILPYILRF